MSTADSSYPVTERTRAKRRSERAHYDRETVHAILDEGLVCHVAFLAGDQPMAIPTAYARDGDSLLFHGSTANRMLRTLAGGARASVTVTLIDGLVLARSAFHHSMNYRSVMVFGSGRAIDDPAEKLAALERTVEHIVPGRLGAVRGPSEIETKQTLVVRMAIEEASAKVRTGAPIDEPEDMELAVWAGVVPLTVVAGTPLTDTSGVCVDAVPVHASAYRRGRPRTD